MVTSGVAVTVIDNFEGTRWFCVVLYFLCHHLRLLAHAPVQEHLGYTSFGSD